MEQFVVFLQGFFVCRRITLRVVERLLQLVVAVAVTQGLLPLSLDKLITFANFQQELLLRHDTGVLAVLIIFKVLACADLIEAIPLAGVLGKNALDQLAERCCIRLVFEYFPKLLLHRANQPLVERVGRCRLPERRAQ